MVKEQELELDIFYDFWLYYLSEYVEPTIRRMPVLRTTLVVVFVVLLTCPGGFQFRVADAWADYGFV